MKKLTSKEAYYERLKNLAEVNKASLKESKIRNLGTLIDYKRAADGIAYGIIKENHNYYIKKSGTKKDPNVSDFAYIGGLENITSYQYKSLAEADKQRNMLFQVISESISFKPNKTGSKMILKEDAGEEIDKATEKLDALDTATDAEVEPSAPEGDAEMAAGLEVEPTGEEMPAPEGSEEMPADTGGSEMPAPEGGLEGNEEMPAPEGGDEELPAETGDEEMPVGDEMNGDETKKEIQKNLGKLTEKIRKTEMEDSEVKYAINTFLSAFKDKLRDMEIEDRKQMAKKLTDVVGQEEIEDLGQNVQDTEMAAGVEEEKCSECGSFANYAESRGYGSAEALMECGDEEVGNLISGYANAHNDGLNDGDFDNVALVIKIVNPEILDNLKNEYGHDEYAEKVSPIVTGMNECSQEEGVAKLNELFGGLRSAFGKLGGDIGSTAKKGAQAVGGAAQKVGQAVGGAAQKAGQAVSGAAQKAGQAVGQYAAGVKQAYHAGEVAPAVKKIEAQAANLGQQIANLNSTLTKAGKQPINVGSILTTIKNQLTLGKDVSLGGKVAENIDVSNVQVQPVEEGIGFAPEGQSLGVATVKPDGAPTTVSESKGGNKVPFIKGAKMVKEEKPSAGLTSKEKSDVVKKAKAGEDIGKKGKGFEKVAQKAAEKYGSEEKGEKVAAAAMWKNVKREGVEEKPAMSEAEQKLRKYIRARLEEKTGLKKANLSESKKSSTLLKLDAIIDKQYSLYESLVKEKNKK